MPGLYGITSNANISVYNTTGLYNVGNTNVAIKGNVTVSNTLGLYQALGNPVILTNAQQLYGLLDESGNVQFALSNGNTTVRAFTANIGTTAGTYGDPLNIAQVTVGADGRVTNVSNVAIDLTNYSGNLLFVNELEASNIVSSGNITAQTNSPFTGYFFGNGAFLSGLPASSITLTGDVTGSGNTGTPFATTLSATGVTPGIYGDDITVPQITVDAKGRITSVANVVIAGGGTGTYGNANVAAYLPTDPTIQAIQANVTAANVNIASINANVSAANVNIATLFSNAASQQTQIDNINANVAAANTSIQTISANLGAYQTYANGAITSVNANVTAVNVAISSLQANVYSNANVAAYLPINSSNVAGQFFLGNAFFMTGVGAITYSNANVQAFLPTYTGTLSNSSTIVSLTANVGILQGNIGIGFNYANIATVGTNWVVFQSANASYFTYTLSASGNSWVNSATSVNNLTALNGNVVNGNVTAVSYTLGPPEFYTLTFLINRTTYPGLTQTGANSLPSGGPYAGWYANAQVAMYASNATVQALSIDNINSNIVVINANVDAANASIQTLSANVGAFQTYANIIFASDTASGTSFQAAAVSPTTIAKGVPVYISQIISNIFVATPASTSSTATSRVVGLAGDTIPSGPSTGPVLMSGLLSNVNTSSYSLGDILYLGASAGTLTNVAPSSPTTVIQVGTVTRVGTANGAIVVNIDYAGSNYGNANVAAYLPTNPTITAIQANVIAANSSIQTLSANIGAYQTFANANAATQATAINSINANVTAANSAIASTDANVTAANSAISTLQTNAATQATQINSINANVAAANLAIANIAANSNTYSNANVAAFLPVYGGNIFVSNVTGGVVTFDTTTVRFPGNQVIGNGAAQFADISFADRDISGVDLLSATRIQVGTVQATGNVSTNQYFLGDGSQLTNLPVQTGTYSNANVAAYLPTDATITAIQANVTAANASIQTISANLGAYQTYANGAITSVNANVTAANSAITSINANVTAANSAITSINANVTAANVSIQTISANLGAFQTYTNSTFQTFSANSGAYQVWANGAISDVNANITAANVNIADLYTKVYSNANVAAYMPLYLPTYSGDLGNIVIQGNLTVNGNVTTINYDEYVAGLLVANSTTPSYDTTSGALIVKGGAGIAGNVNAGAFYSDVYNFANGVSIITTATGTYSNANVASYLPVYGGDIRVTNVYANTSIQTIQNVVTDSILTITPGNLFIQTGSGVIPSGSIAISEYGINASASIGGYNIQTNGNVTAGYFIGNGSYLTNINAGNIIGAYGNANVASYLPVYGGTINVLNITGVAGQSIAIEPDGTGDILLQADTIQIGDNNQDVTIASRGTGNITLRTHFNNGAEGNITLVHGTNGNIILWPNGTGTVEIKDALHATGNVYAGYYFGDGSQLSNLPTQTGTYSNVNVAAYIPTDPTITAIQANVTAANAAIQTLDANVGAYQTWANGRITTLDANLGTVSTEITAIQSNVSAANASIQTLSANVGAFETYANIEFQTFSANLGAYQTYTNTAIQTLDANVGAFETYANLEFNTINANVGAYQIWANGAISTIDANLGAFQTYSNTRIGTLEANVGAFETYANTTFATITSLQTLDANVGAFETYANLEFGTINANLGAFQTYANTTFGAATYSNANVAAFLLTNTGNISADYFLGNGYFLTGITSGGGSTYGNANVAAYLPTDPTIQGINANVTAANSAIATLDANVGAYETWANGRITTLDANLGTATTNITTLFANAATQAVAIDTLNANVGAYQIYANGQFSTFSANSGAFQTYANATFYKSGSVITAANVISTNGYFWSNGVAYSTGGGTYGNTQVAAFLPVYGGNISAANMYATSANVTGLMFFGSSYKETVYAFGTTSGTLTVNVANGTIQTATINGNITINTNNFTNLGPGQSVTLVIVQDATGGRTLTSNVLFAGNAKTLTNAASAIDTLSVFYDGTRYLGALVKGYV